MFALVFCSRCRGLVCGLWLWYFLVIISCFPTYLLAKLSLGKAVILFHLETHIILDKHLPIAVVNPSLVDTMAVNVDKIVTNMFFFSISGKIVFYIGLLPI